VQDSHDRLQLDMLRAQTEGWHFGAPCKAGGVPVSITVVS